MIGFGRVCELNEEGYMWALGQVSCFAPFPCRNALVLFCSWNWQSVRVEWRRIYVSSRLSEPAAAQLAGHFARHSKPFLRPSIRSGGWWSCWIGCFLVKLHILSHLKAICFCPFLHWKKSRWFTPHTEHTNPPPSLQIVHVLYIVYEMVSILGISTHARKFCHMEKLQMKRENVTL